MEPVSSPPRGTPEQGQVALPTEGPGHRVAMDQDLVEHFMIQVTESALGVLDFSRQWKEYEEMMECKEESLRKHALELQKKQKDSDFKQSLEANLMILVLEMQTEEVVSQLTAQQKLLKDSMAKKHEELKRELQVRKEELDARQKVLSLFDETIKEKSNELKKKEDKFQLKQDAEAREMDVKSNSLELKLKKYEELMKELEVRKHELEVSQKELTLLDETIQEASTELEKREEQFQLKRDADSRETQVKMNYIELKDKKLEELMRELQVRKDELEARQKDLSLFDETMKEKSYELEKKENKFQLKQDADARDIEVKSKSLELKEKKLEEVMRELEVRKQELESWQKELILLQLKQDAESREIEVKSKSLELNEKKLDEREEVLERKEKELDVRSKQAENRKRSRDEFEPSFSADKDRDDDSLIHPGKKHKPIREHNHDDKEKETYLDCVLYGMTSSDPATASEALGRGVYEVVCIDDKEKETDSDCVLYGMTRSDPASATASEAMGREVYEVVCIDDKADEDPEPYSCPDPDFNDFNNSMSSFAVGQIWALYDPIDHMPRYYAQIRNILKHQLRVRVTWLESKQTTEDEKSLPIACGAFKHGEQTVCSHLMFSHEMQHIKGGRNGTIINPRKGETWALFRDWNSHREQHKRPYRYDFVQVVSEFDSYDGIGVAYLGRVEGFTSVYKLAEQHGVLEMMIPSDEMLRFSHRVPSFKLTGDEKEGVPPGSFELDPAAIPRDCLEIEAAKVKEEEISHSLGLCLLQG